MAALIRGVLCNWLVCMAVWQAASAQDIGSKALAIWFPISSFVAMGFEHSVANMFFLPLGILLGAEVTWKVKIHRAINPFHRLIQLCWTFSWKLHAAKPYSSPLPYLVLHPRQPPSCHNRQRLGWRRLRGRQLFFDVRHPRRQALRQVSRFESIKKSEV